MNHRKPADRTNRARAQAKSSDAGLTSRPALGAASLLIDVLEDRNAPAILTGAGAQIQFSALAGEVNNLRIEVIGANLRFTDSNRLTITPGPNAPTPVGSNAAEVPLASVNTITVLLGDLDDTMDAAGIPVAVNGNGNEGNDTLIGGEGIDTLDGDGFVLPGTAGNDSIVGGGGNDTIFGRDGDDTVSGGAGNDSIDGGLGDDLINGDAGSDFIQGNDGRDRINAGDDNDTITGGRGDDLLSGGEGDDSINGDAGEDVIAGDGGNDSIIGGDHNDTIFGGAGNDFAQGDLNLANPAFPNAVGEDSLDGGDGDDTLVGLDGVDSLLGGAGNDRLEGNRGNDVYQFADNWGVDNPVELVDQGDDALDFSLTTTDVTFQVGTDVVPPSAVNRVVFDSDVFEILRGGSGNDEFILVQGTNVGEGNGEIDGGAGTDRIRYLPPGVSPLTPVPVDGDLGGDPNQFVVVNLQDFAVEVAPITGPTVPANTATGVGFIDNVESAVGTAGSDILIGSNGGGGEFLGLTGNDSIIGGNEPDRIFGGNGNDYLNGRAGNDFIDGGQGDDILSGDAGDDTLEGGSGNNTIFNP